MFRRYVEWRFDDDYGGGGGDDEDGDGDTVLSWGPYLSLPRYNWLQDIIQQSIVTNDSE